MPAPTKASHTASPIPALAPVTIATFPLHFSNDSAIFSKNTEHNDITIHSKQSSETETQLQINICARYFLAAPRTRAKE